MWLLIHMESKLIRVSKMGPDHIAQPLLYWIYITKYELIFAFLNQGMAQLRKSFFGKGKDTLSLHIQ